MNVHRLELLSWTCLTEALTIDKCLNYFEQVKVRWEQRPE